MILPVLLGFALLKTPVLKYMEAPVADVSPELLSLKEEITRQGDIAEAVVLSRSDELQETSRQIPAPVVEGLNRFFNDPRAKRLFIDNHKRCCLSWPVQNRMKKDNGMRLRLLQKNKAAYAEPYGKVQLDQAEFDVLLAGLVHDYGLINIENHGNNFAFTSQLWPNALVKIAKLRWIDNDAMLAFPYQLVSRVFYNIELNKCIKDNGYDANIVSFPKSLYHLPGTPEDVNDDNYVVVEPLLPCPSESENNSRFKSMTVKELVEGHGEHAFVKTAYCDAICALIALIQNSGLWCITNSNVFFLDNDKIALVDTERPGLGGGEWRFFFHQGEGAAAEIGRNAIGGFDGLIDLLGTKQ